MRKVRPRSPSKGTSWLQFEPKALRIKESLSFTVKRGKRGTQYRNKRLLYIHQGKEGSREEPLGQEPWKISLRPTSEACPVPTHPKLEPP